MNRYEIFTVIKDIIQKHNAVPPTEKEYLKLMGELVNFADGKPLDYV